MTWVICLFLLVSALNLSAEEEEVSLASTQDQFEILVEYAPKISRPGYVFKLTLIPSRENEFKKFNQNFYFLIDRSNSIPRARFFHNKRAIAAALDFLKPGDRFNILVFDSLIVHFQPKEVECSSENISQARAFLDSLGHGGYFAARELLASLTKLIPQNVSEEGINNAILLSNGETYLSQENQRQIIGNLTRENRGKINLYTVASGKGNNIPLLGLLSALNKGSLIYAPSNERISDSLSYFMRTLQCPIGKNLAAKAIALDKSMTVLLQPKSSLMPDLYQYRPFVIYGTTNKLLDFTLELSWTEAERSFTIQKRVSFENGKMGAYPIERGWTQLLVQEFYERYFEEGDLTHLQSAKKLLVPLNLPTPLID